MADQQQQQQQPRGAGTLAVPSRPRVMSRTFSAPLMTSQKQGVDGQEHEANSDSEVYVAVVGSAGVGKSTFIQQSLGLANKPTTAVSARRISVDSATYVVRMLECQLDDVTVDAENRISWPLDKRIPRVDAALTLYDVSNKDTFEEVPVVLNALEKASVPSVLVSCKCDIEPAQRQIDPDNVEQRAKSILRSLDTLQTSTATSHVDSPARGIAFLLQAVSGKSTSICPLPFLLLSDPAHLSANAHSPLSKDVCFCLHHSLSPLPSCATRPQRLRSPPADSSPAQRDPASSRRRTISSALQSVATPRSNSHQGHTRANSELSGTMRKEIIHDRHDSTVVIPGSTSANRHVDGIHDDASNSSQSDHSSSSDDEDRLDVDTQSEAPSDERGYSFDNLVDRLLKLPKSKADTRYASVFLALYRKFAAPGQLLEAIVHRFEALETDNVPFMTRTVSQLRFLSVIEQWIGSYPGDFAHPKTRRRMRTFVAKLSNTRIFSAAAREMSSDLDVVAEDDDTNWACCDKDRERTALDSNITWSSRVSRLLDDPTFDFGDNLGSLSLDGGSNRNSNQSLQTDFGMLQTIDAARRQAPSLVPSPKTPISKAHWHMLMDIPADTIACELTRIDWIMFSAMRPRDLVRHVSLNQTQKASCKSLVHVSRMIDQFNHLRDWVANFILLRDKAKHRVLMLEKFMHVARKLRELNNYNSLGAFLAGISSAAVHRLIATRELLAPETVKDWMKLEILMSPTRSYSAYRLAWENSSGERIPFLPLPIRDLVAAEEGNKTYMGEEVDGRINWRKFEVMGDTIVGIQKAQGLPYRNSMLGPRNDELRSLILNNAMIRDDEALYERSLHVESSGGGDRRGLREFFKR